MRSSRRSRVIAAAAATLVGVALLSTLRGGTSAAFSDQDTTPGNLFAADTLAPPTGLTATRGLLGLSVNLSWDTTTSSWASGYRILRGTSSGGPYSQIAQVSGVGTTNYTDGSPGLTTKYYVVRAYYAGTTWESVNSNQASA
jgi:hypothetical protein